MSDQSLKVFTTSASKSESVPAGEDQTVKIDDREITFQAPTVSHIILMASMLEGAKDEKRRAAIIINWFFSMLPPLDRGYFETRLFDHADDFDLVNITEVIDYLMEQWSSRPTQPSSTSSGSHSPAGKKSTGKRHGKHAIRGASTSDSGAPSSTGGSHAALAPKAEPSSTP
jgi:hypothetical protein